MDMSYCVCITFSDAGGICGVYKKNNYEPKPSQFPLLVNSLVLPLRFWKSSLDLADGFAVNM